MGSWFLYKVKDYLQRNNVLLQKKIKHNLGYHYIN
jgi:hypothetical protein